MHFISECTLFRNRIKYIFKSLHFGNFINSGIKWVTRIPKAVIRKRVNVSGMYFGYVPQNGKQIQMKLTRWL